MEETLQAVVSPAELVAPAGEPPAKRPTKRPAKRPGTTKRLAKRSGTAKRPARTRKPKALKASRRGARGRGRGRR